MCLFECILHIIVIIKKYRIWKTLNLLTGAESSTKKINIYMCRVLHVAYRLSPVTCHLSLTPTATATYLASANSPTMHSRLVRKDPRTQTNFKTRKIIKKAKQHKTSRGMPILAICTSTRYLQSTIKRVFQTWTDRQTDGHCELQTTLPVANCICFTYGFAPQ